MKLRKLGSNQTEISVGDNLVLFSYNTPVAAWVRGRGWLRTEQKFSKTTTKHINAWLRNVSIVGSVDQSYLDNLIGF